MKKMFYLLISLLIANMFLSTTVFAAKGCWCESQKQGEGKWLFTGSPEERLPLTDAQCKKEKVASLISKDVQCKKFVMKDMPDVKLGQEMKPCLSDDSGRDKTKSVYRLFQKGIIFGKDVITK